MKNAFVILNIIFSSFTSKATIHTMKVWDGYFQFVDAINLSSNITIQLGDTVQWLPLDMPLMVHTITSTNIPSGAVAFDQIWQVPADTFFQYIPQIVGLYNYECTPHAISHGMVGSINVIGVNGVSDNELQHNNLIYPNPTTGNIYFNTSNTIYPYKIFTQNGKLVQSGTTDKFIDVSTFTNGIYHIQIIGNKPRTIKFLKQ